MNTTEYLINLIGVGECATLKGKCHDCKKEVSIDLEISTGGEVFSTGAFWHIEEVGNFFKCEACLLEEPYLKNFRPCEVWSRVVGYLRPIKQFNKGKQEEFRERKNFDLG